MATFTFASTTTTKIDITSGTGDWDDLYTDVLAAVGDESVMARAGSGTDVDPYIYTVVGTNCEVELSGTTDLTVAQYQEVDWAVAAGGDSFLLDIQANATFRMKENTRINLNTNTGANERRIEVLGQMICIGTSGNEAIIENVDYVIFRTDRACTFDWVIYQDFTDIGSQCFYFNYFGDAYGQGSHSFTNVTVKTSAASHLGYGFYFYLVDGTKLTLDNITMTDLYRSPYIMGSSVKFANSTFESSSSCSPFSLRAGLTGPYYRAQNDDTDPFKNGLEQPKTTFDTCTFDANYGGSYACHPLYSGIIKFKNCTFSNATVGIRASYETRILLEGGTAGQTFAAIATNKQWVNRGTYYDVYPLTLSVQDQNGNELEGATVIVTQSEGYETHTFQTTTADGSQNPGNVKDLHGDDPVFVYREEYALNTYDVWSDSIANGRYHTIIITKEGFQNWERRVTFTEAKTITATLIPATGPRLVRSQL